MRKAVKFKCREVQILSRILPMIVRWSRACPLILGIGHVVVYNSPALGPVINHSGKRVGVHERACKRVFQSF